MATKKDEQDMIMKQLDDGLAKLFALYLELGLISGDEATEASKKALKDITRGDPDAKKDLITSFVMTAATRLGKELAEKAVRIMNETGMNALKTKLDGDGPLTPKDLLN